MTEKILEVCLEDDYTIKTTKEVYEPRYTGEIIYDNVECEWYINDMKEVDKIYTTKQSREGFDTLDTGEKWEPSGTSVEDDIQSFQDYLDKTYGKDEFEAFALGAYIHGSVSFALNKGPDTRCKWDSGTIGFIGIPKSLVANASRIAEVLTDAWNGSILTYRVYDNYDDEPIDEISSTCDYQEVEKWKDDMAEKYKIDWNKVEPETY